MPLRWGGSLVSKVRQVSHRVFWNMLRERGLEDLHPEQGKILFALMGAPEGLLIGEIAASTMLKKSTLTTVLARMEANGYLTRAADRGDGRATRVRLTDKFRQKLDDYERVSLDMTSIYYRGFEEREIDLFESMLERILGNLIEYEQRGKEEEQ